MLHIKKKIAMKHTHRLLFSEDSIIAYASLPEHFELDERFRHANNAKIANSTAGTIKPINNASIYSFIVDHNLQLYV